MLTVLDLFSGIGGFSLGLERTGGFKTVAFCEIDEFPRRVLAKHWPGVPIHQDVRELRAEHVGAVDVICGGYPCQPFSLAGKREGTADDRHLWPEMRRLVDELRPSWVIGENVIGHVSMGLDAVLSDLDALGYACRPFVIPALAVGAPHQRLRLWIVAHAKELFRDGGNLYARGNREGVRAGGAVWKSQGNCENEGLAHADQPGLEARRQTRDFDCQGKISRQHVARCGGATDWWGFEPDVGRVAHGVPSRVDRLRGLGNAVVPQIPEIIGRAILAAEIDGASARSAKVRHP